MLYKYIVHPSKKNGPRTFFLENISKDFSIITLVFSVQYEVLY